MIGEKPRHLREHLPALFPALMLGIFFVVPFAIMVMVSVSQTVKGGAYIPGFELTHYARFFTPFFGRVLGFSIFVAALTATSCVAVGFPFTYLLTRLSRGTQILWLVFILAVLSLSEVIIGFSWSVLLSRTAGVSNLLVWIGLMEKPVSWSPGLPALLCGLCYLAFSYTVLVLYPPLSRLDRELPEAARMLGATPLRAFLTVVVPVMRRGLISALIMVFVFTLGAYLLPQVLGRPQHWTLSVLITDQAIFQSNLPFSAAMAIFLMVVSLALVMLTSLLMRRSSAV